MITEKLKRKHIVISGTGRTGTTFLIELLTNLGLETGVCENSVTPKNETANAGFEYDIRKEGAPYIIKNPHFCDYVKEVLNRKDIVIEHVFIPMRELSAAAESRRHVTRMNQSKIPIRRRVKIQMKRIFTDYKPKVFAGGLWSTSKQSDQELVLLEKNYNLILALSESHIPVTLLKYPKHLKDSAYLFEKLQPVIQGISYVEFQKIHQKTVRPELIHSFGKEDF